MRATRTPTPLARRQLIFLVYFMHLLSFTMGGPLLPVLRRHFHLPAVKIGMVTSAFPFGMLFALAIFPSLSDRYGRKPILITCFSGLSCGLMLQGRALLNGWSFEAFLRLRALSGAFAGCAAVIKAFLADSYSQELPKAMALREAAGTAAYIVGPSLGGVLICWGGLASIPYAGVVLSMGAVMLLLFVPEAQAIRADAEPQEEEKVEVPWALLSTVLVVHFLYALSQSVFDAFFGVWCAESFNLSPARVGHVLTFLASLVFLAHFFAYNRLVSRFGVLSVAVLGLLAMAGSFGGMWCHCLPLVLTLYAVGVPAFTPSVPTLLAKMVGRRRRGRLIALDGLVMSVGRILAPVLWGLLYEQDQCWAFGISAGALFLAAGLMASRRQSIRRTLAR